MEGHCASSDLQELEVHEIEQIQEQFCTVYLCKVSAARLIEEQLAGRDIWHLVVRLVQFTKSTRSFYSGA